MSGEGSVYERYFPSPSEPAAPSELAEASEPQEAWDTYDEPGEADSEAYTAEYADEPDNLALSDKGRAGRPLLRRDGALPPRRNHSRRRRDARRAPAHDGRVTA